MKLVWVRRSLVIPAVIMLFVSVQCSLFLNLIANDFQDPEFYMEILSEGSAYSFISVELPGSVYQEFKEFHSQFQANSFNILPISQIINTH